MTLTKTLTNWYSIHKRHMPWRMTKKPYRIWLSEIILQQTQVKQGLPYYEAFVANYPTVFDLAKASEEDVLKLWQGLGYYSRARNLHHTAKYVATELKGDFPGTYEGLLKLKGVGDYTASAIGSICFGLPTAVVDGNVYRALSRYFGIRTPINSTQGIKEFKTLAQGILDKDNPGDHNQAIMEFGARQCKPVNPDCSVCPLMSNCVAFNEELINELPLKLKKTKLTKKHFNYLVILTDNSEVILERRTGKGIWQNLYQFPLIESEKSLTMASLRRNEMFRDLTNGNFRDLWLHNEKDIIHKLSHQHLHTKFWIVLMDEVQGRKIALKDIKKYPVPVLIDNFIKEFDFDQS